MNNVVLDAINRRQPPANECELDAVLDAMDNAPPAVVEAEQPMNDNQWAPLETH